MEMAQQPLSTPLAHSTTASLADSLRRLDRDIARPTESFPTRRWWIAFILCASGAAYFVAMLGLTVIQGTGVWGINIPVGWGFAIINFVFWIGIGHAGTLISAILYLLRQRWRTAISRFAEAMTIFAVMTAGIFPIIHTGRPWLAWYWLFPLPNANHVWINFRSPLAWDVFAVSTYFTVSLLFWYTGLLPDIAILRDRARNPIRKAIYGILCLGWKGSARGWHHYEAAYLLFAGLSTPLVLSVHSIVSFDFAVSVVPGWHSTIFPPYFVAGAIFSGMAMVSMCLIVLRKMFRLERIITVDHLEVMNKVLIFTSLIVSFAYMAEFFIAWYGGVAYERYVMFNRVFGNYAWSFWIMFSCNALIPQLFWFRPIRRSLWLIFPIVICVNIGMWFERFVIVVTSLHRDFLPSIWRDYAPTWVDLSLLAGSFAFFFTLLLLFCRVLPSIAMAEMKVGMADEHHGAKGGGHA